ncbi:MAG: hypothetical protein Q4C30_10255 [Bacteroidia bacterium]|nr:hypothetical protein [Bacteroidia bacterium]
MEEIRLNVLWIDDQYESNEPFLDVAYENGIDITPVSYVDQGIELLKNQSSVWHAVILDCNCKRKSDNEAPSLDALRYAIDEIRSIDSNLKWFPYTAGEGFKGADAIEFILGQCSWLGQKKIYKKTQKGDDVALCQYIKEVVNVGNLIDIQMKYKNVLSVLPCHGELLSLLYKYDNDRDAFSKDQSVPNQIRDILDCLFSKFEHLGILQENDFTVANLYPCYKDIICHFPNDIIPKYIKGALNFIIEYANAGSHKNTALKDSLTTQQNLYLNTSAIETLLMLLSWVSTIVDIQRNEAERAAIEYRYFEKNQKK